ncbi:MAG: RsmB/NOP family class I SAM-dependent RNA methyltransferase [Candidatus Micrarchaeota archaeon]
MEPQEFKDWLSTYTNADQCLEAFRNQKEFFRVNTIKMDVDRFQLTTKIKCKKSPYCAAGFELEETNYAIGRTWEYFLGYIYPQSLSSMLVSPVLDPKPGECILDVAASPGSKFSHMAMLMQNKGVLVANDIKKDKISAIYSTINRLNILNSIVTVRDGTQLDWKERFDKILLDAPCTALGSGESAPERWQLENSQKISVLQKKMLFSAYDALKKGGELVYSTCTYAKEENEAVVANLLDNVSTAKLESIELDIPHESGLSEYGNEFKKVYRIYPQHINSEGFFIAKIKKSE